VSLSESDAQFIARMLVVPNDDLKRLIQLCRRERGMEYDETREHQLMALRGTDHVWDPEDDVSVESVISMLSTWSAQAEPVNAQLKITFSRALMDSAVGTLREYVRRHYAT
jgi:hypothetical protein